MDGSVTTSEFNELLKDGAELQTTVVDFGDAVVRRVKKNDLSILSVSGQYSRALGREIERICLQCRTNLGLEFTDIKVNPTLRKKFDSSIVGVLRNVRDAFHARRKLLLLCTPPSELVDLLKLTGVYSGYQVIEKPSSAITESDLSLAMPSREPNSRRGGSGPPAEEVQKKIVHLNQSLKRTATLEKGLDSAEKCVRRLLPQSSPSVPGYDFAHSYRTSEKVGGDFFDFIALGDDRLGVVIGDVSGHGLDAALMMGISKKVINLRARGVANASPYEVLCQANADLVGDFRKYSFVTALYGVLELESGNFRFVRAGHEMPILFDADSHTVLESRGIPLGIDRGRNFNRLLEERSIELEAGSSLLFCTDGLTECWNTRGACYTRERLLFSLSQVRTDLSSKEVLEDILGCVAEFAGDRSQEDDMTTILLKRNS